MSMDSAVLRESGSWFHSVGAALEKLSPLYTVEVGPWQFWHTNFALLVLTEGSFRRRNNRLIRPETGVARIGDMSIK